jgi:DNA invertase Pin-like site-specific DNA recombinase
VTDAGRCATASGIRWLGLRGEGRVGLLACKRPQWEQLNADIAAELIDAIMRWHVDRLTRSPRELEYVIDLRDQHGIEFITCTGDIDRSTPTGSLIARALGTSARHEAEHKGERQHRQAAEQGKPHSGQRGHGYTPAESPPPPVSRQWSRQDLRLVVVSRRISSRREYKAIDSYEPATTPCSDRSPPIDADHRPRRLRWSR